MPIVNGAYVAPTWVNGSTPAISAAELQAVSNTLAKVPVKNGGTGATTVAAARKNLGLGNTSGAIPIANGGTGATTAAAARKNLGLGNTSGALPIANGGTGESDAPSAAVSLMGRGTFAGDFDTALDFGEYWCDLSQCTHGPATSGFGWLIVGSHVKNTNLRVQRFTFYLGNSTFVRSYVNSQWYPWEAPNKISTPVSVANGGTGQTTGAGAANALINALSAGTTPPVDADYYISQAVGGGTTTTTYHRRPMSALWSYIQGKISSVLGLTASGYKGRAASATKLAAARTLRTNLGSTTAASFDGSKNITPGVTGTLPVSNGGTGVTTAQALMQSLFNSAAAVTSYPTKPGIYRCIGTNVCTNSQSTLTGYGVLVIFQAVYGMHLYLDNNGTMIYGYSGDTFQQPGAWKKISAV